jgi:hypothetical protein
MDGIQTMNHVAEKWVPMHGMSSLQTKNHLAKVGTYEWDVLFINNKTSGLKRVPIDGMFCLQTIKHVVKRGYLWVGCPVYKR